jgi:flagellar motor switch protein FliG
MALSTALARAPERAEFTGCQKAAILCMALGVEEAAKITQRLSSEEVELISVEIAKMERVDPVLAEHVLLEWIETAVANDALASGGTDYARDILEKSFGQQKAAGILKRVMTQLADSAGLVQLRRADPQQLANMFRQEHPQTIALVLAHLSPGHTAGVIKEFERPLGADVALRMARMQKVSSDMLQLVERSLGSDFDLNRGMSHVGGPAAVAAVLNLLQGTIEKSILESISGHDPELSTHIKNLMFVFEDLIRVDDKGIQRILKDVDTKSLAIALKGSSAELRKRITSQMSQRAVAALHEEMEVMGPVRMKEVELAQSAIVDQARALEDAGEIVLNAGIDDVVVA